jgi:hypothetical protein
MDMNCPTANPLLKPGARPALAAAFNRYPQLYDQLLDEVHSRLNSAGYATKLDLAALATWKHVHNARWLRTMLKLPSLEIQQKTQSAFASNKSDRERIDALKGIPGFGSGGAFTSVLLSAWQPAKFGVYDSRASRIGWDKVVSATCRCSRKDLVVYFFHLRQMAWELASDWSMHPERLLGPDWTPPSNWVPGTDWMPRDVDKALYVLADS